MLSSAALFDENPTHEACRLLQDKVAKVRQTPDRAFQIVEAINAANEEFFKSLDVGRSFYYFLHNPPAQLILK